MPRCSACDKLRIGVHGKIMTKPIQLQAPTAASRVWAVFKRIFALILLLLATIGFFANATGLVSIWLVRQPARRTVTALSTLVNSKLERVDHALARVRERADDARQAVTRVNNAANNLGDQFEERSPLLTALASAAGDDLAPKIVDAREQAAAIHDGVVSVNAALETLDSLGFIAVPTFTDELSAVSKRLDAAPERCSGAARNDRRGQDRSFRESRRGGNGAHEQDRQWAGADQINRSQVPVHSCGKATESE